MVDLYIIGEYLSIVVLNLAFLYHKIYCTWTSTYLKYAILLMQKNVLVAYDMDSICILMYFYTTFF